MKAEYDFKKGKRGAVIPGRGKERITIRLDKKVLDWFRKKADEQGQGGYQTLINKVLWNFIKNDKPVEDRIRSILQAELQNAGFTPVEEGEVVKTVHFNETGIRKLPNDKPVVYKILSGGGRNNYTGVALRGRVQQRLREHLPGGKDRVPGSKVQVEQMPSSDEARAKKERILSRSKPPYNKEVA